MIKHFEIKKIARIVLAKNGRYYAQAENKTSAEISPNLNKDSYRILVEEGQTSIITAEEAEAKEAAYAAKEAEEKARISAKEAEEKARISAGPQEGGHYEIWISMGPGVMGGADREGEIITYDPCLAKDLEEIQKFIYQMIDEKIIVIAYDISHNGKRYDYGESVYFPFKNYIIGLYADYED